MTNLPKFKPGQKIERVQGAPKLYKIKNGQPYTFKKMIGERLVIEETKQNYSAKFWQAYTEPAPMKLKPKQPDLSQYKAFPEGYVVPKGVKVIVLKESRLEVMSNFRKPGLIGVVANSSIDGIRCEWPDGIKAGMYSHELAPLDPKDHPDYVEPEKEKPLRKVTDLGKNECIHCPTEEEAIAICNLMHDAGMKWCNEGSYKGSNDWDKYNSNTCYLPIPGIFSPKDFFEKEGFAIYPASDFLDEFNVGQLQKDIAKDITERCENVNSGIWGRIGKLDKIETINRFASICRKHNAQEVFIDLVLEGLI